MDVKRLTDNANVTVGLEIESIYISIGSITKLLTLSQHTSHVRRRRIFSKETEIHVRFRYKDVECVVWETWGDSDVYWIMPDDNNGSLDLLALESLFQNHQPGVIRRTLADFLTLKWAFYILRRMKK